MRVKDITPGRQRIERPFNAYNMRKKTENLVDKFDIVGFVNSDYVGLTMSEAAGDHRTITLSFTPEAAAYMGFTMSGYEPPALYPFDLISYFLPAKEIGIEKLVLYENMEGKIRSRLYLKGADGDEYTVEAHPSHSIPLVHKMRGKIYITEEIFIRDAEDRENNTIERITLLDVNPEEAFKLLREMPVAELEALSEEELQRYLTASVEEEDFPLAAKLRDIIKTIHNK